MKAAARSLDSLCPPRRTKFRIKQATHAGHDRTSLARHHRDSWHPGQPGSAEAGERVRERAAGAGCSGEKDAGQPGMLPTGTLLIPDGSGASRAGESAPGRTDTAERARGLMKGRSQAVGRRTDASQTFPSLRNPPNGIRAGGRNWREGQSSAGASGVALGTFPAMLCRIGASCNGTLRSDTAPD